MAPESGGWVHWEASAGTTSLWFSRINGGSSPPSSTAQMLPRPGMGSTLSQGMPSASKISAKKSTARVSLPGGLMVSTWA
jgi:hypothetical protein